jgi:hypothetical protein
MKRIEVRIREDGSVYIEGKAETKDLCKKIVEELLKAIFLKEDIKDLKGEIYGVLCNYEGRGDNFK